MRFLKLPLTAAVLLAVACVQGPAEDHGTRSDAIPPGERVQKSDLDQLEQEIRTLARADGCAADQQCRAAPFGAKPCGGPWEYIVYCALTTDTVALTSRLEEYRRLEQRYNEQEGLVSDCMLVMEPPVEARGGSCRAAAR